MAKVIVERPRKKGGASKKPKGYARQLQRCGEDGPPRCEGIKTRWQGRMKTLNEHLGPLRRYLDSQVGRPWDKVFAEICAHINRNSAVQDHVRDHVDEYVTIHVLLIDGVPCSGAGDWTYGKPLHQTRWRPWYVCPRTGLLRRVKELRKPSDHARKRLADSACVRVSNTEQFRYFDGSWHLVTLKPLPLSTGDRMRNNDRDILLDRRLYSITPEEAQRFYGAAVYATAMRRLARREVRQYPIPIEPMA